MCTRLQKSEHISTEITAPYVLEYIEVLYTVTKFIVMFRETL